MTVKKKLGGEVDIHCHNLAACLISYNVEAMLRDEWWGKGSKAGTLLNGTASIDLWQAGQGRAGQVRVGQARAGWVGRWVQKEQGKKWKKGWEKRRVISKGGIGEGRRGRNSVVIGSGK